MNHSFLLLKNWRIDLQSQEEVRIRFRRDFELHKEPPWH